MSIAVIGAGSLGLLFAGKLSCAGEEITVITRTGQQAQEIGRNGITVEDHDQSTISHPAAIRGLSTLSQTDWIFLMLKQPHIDASFAEELSKRKSPDSYILCFQNGIGHVETLSRWLPRERIYIAVTTEAARKESHALVRHTGSGDIRLGPAGAGEESWEAALAPLLKMFHRAGFTALASKNMESVVWNKLVANAVINPLTAILRLRNGELLSSAAYRSLMRRLFDEALTVARTRGIDLGEENWEQILQVCERTANNQSSMLQDMLRGNRSEIDWINGSIIRIAAEYGIDVPGHAIVYQMIKGLEEGNERNIVSSD